MTFYILLGVLGAFLLWTAVTYNLLVRGRQHVREAWADIDTELKRRYDLIPNLVATVQGASNFEKSTLIAVTEARTKWLNAQTPREQVAAANQLEGALARLLVVVERYPDLKANPSFMALQDELAGTENRIAVERKKQRYAV